MLAGGDVKVVMIGGMANPNHLEERYSDKGWEFWGLNAIRAKWATDIPWTRWFNLHRIEHLFRDWEIDLLREIYWANKHAEIPFYTVGDWTDEISHATEFPIDSLRSMPRGGIYHAGSFDMMTAFAIHLGATEIAFHGVRLNMESGEPISARACLEYWCGMAEAKGCKITCEIGRAHV